jgi:AraC-like DNA-binding protein/quercetin dioxygenase-like cupin family protein
MDTKRFVLSFYKDATGDFHITRITQPREALSLHSHGYYQIYYVSSGRLLHHIENSTAELAAGDVFILPPNVPHYIEKLDDTLSFYSLSFMPDYMAGQKESNKLVTDFLYYLTTQPIGDIQPKFTLSYEDMGFAEMLLKRILEEFSQNKTGKDALIRQSVALLLCVLARVYLDEKAQMLTTQESKKLVLYCIEYVNNHFNEDITLQQMVRLSAMSKTCFCAIFKSIVGTSFKDYLNSYRISHATELLLKGGKISEAASRCGYSDLSTFYRNFRKYKGVSPQQFLQEHK